jgi:alpha,alpha-trehalase
MRKTLHHIPEVITIIPEKINDKSRVSTMTYGITLYRRMVCAGLVPLSFFLNLLTSDLYSQSFTKPVFVEVRSTLDSLVYDEDTDGDKKITIDDQKIIGTDRGDKRFWIKTESGSYEVSGTYFLSNLLQELKLAEEAGKDSLLIDPEKIFEPPVERISRMISEHFWDGLTRIINEEGLINIIDDDKTETIDGFSYIYIPPSDKLAYEHYSKLQKSINPHIEKKIKIVHIADKVTGKYVRSLDGYHGLLSLAVVKENNKTLPLPFVVPGGRFNEMYGWDSYFITLGLLRDNRIELAKSMVDNFVYEINNYGKILNANRTYYLTRSQPPFLTSMIREVYRHLPEGPSTKEWLRNSLEAAIKEYEDVWMGKDHLTSTGLSRYFDVGYGVPPEVEPGHYNTVFAAYADIYGMEIGVFEEAYKSGKLKIPELDEYFIHDRAMRESGHDTSYRLIGVCASLVTVDLNSLIYKIETDIAEIIEEEFNGNFESTSSSKDWFNRAERRKKLVNQYLWNPDKGLFFDYNYADKKQTEYISATIFYPLWAGLATTDQAALVKENLLSQLEFAGGIAGSTEESRGPVSEERPLRQWDYPFGWAPHQMIVWQALINYGYENEAQRLIYRWLYTITSNAVNYNGTVPEKFDVVRRSHEVFAEYGNVGTKFAYITREGFGWTNASFKVGLNLLTPSLRNKLNRLVPPEWVF